ncbi:MAG: hypothetical protein AAF497_12155 [Planctomycetota bacterium]
MLGTTEEVQTAERSYRASNSDATSERNVEENTSVSTRPSLLSRILRIEWLGQMVASLCWIASVFSYGLNSSGDWLQLFAASAWMIANIAALLTAES